ncbi:MAG: translation initiation factor IF-6 [Candidatus Anstonellales archaeon]
MIKKTSYFGNPHIGIFCFCNDKVAILPYNNKFSAIIKEALDVEIIETTISQSPFIGIYTAGNNDILIMPDIISSSELTKIKNGLDGIADIYLIKTNMNALGNNIVVGKKAILINPNLMPYKDSIEDIFGIETIAIDIAGYKTIGSLLVTNDKGFVVSYKAGLEDLARLEKILGIRGKRTSINLGLAFPKLGIIANKKGIVFGELTTGIEIANVIEGLDVQ